MKFITMRELKINPTKVLKGLSKDGAVITRNGKPAAALIALDEDMLDDFIIANHPELLKSIDAAKDEYRGKGGISHDEMRLLVEKRRG
ncbi:MAG: type II toxin-antitoxin system Phd/YefM family antitoxin [Planctomycetes bacterium]|nr:type II toxin-antitoxin system Phd/YefM family antitoxin [Planctomycetota bacterium]